MRFFSSNKIRDKHAFVWSGELLVHQPLLRCKDTSPERNRIKQAVQELENNMGPNRFELESATCVLLLLGASRQRSDARRSNSVPAELYD
jgi:hypothetical protein